MRRKLFLTLLCADLLVCLAILVFGVRSYWVEEEVVWSRNVPGIYGYEGEAGLPNTYRMVLSRAGRVVVERSVFPDADRIGPGPRAEPAVRYVHNFHGFDPHPYYEPPPQFYLLWGWRDYSFVVMIPYWFVLLVLALPLMIYVARRVHRRIRFVPAGCCTSCGYDLRASTDRCPECGEPIPTGQSITPHQSPT